NLVSVIMPAFNAEMTILESINSVLRQSYKNFELIICDDNSTDSTKNIVCSVDDNRIIYLKNLYQKGAAGARNFALDNSNGRYVAFLDSDDVWSEDKLYKQLKYMNENNIYFTYGAYKTFSDDVKVTKGHFIPPKMVAYEKLLRSCPIGCLTVVIDRKFTGSFSFPYIPKEDYACWLTLTNRFGDAYLYESSFDSYYR
ncbi:glycosyltransferase family 2 protein, partial [Shewanella sp. 4t3-1-2LB]|uniref:glycosyltransferase family 2 protein n=1 Tax=Shewanella sp. 4t3-1-2LB TaxID=2817682 RepID=UPI001A991F0D